MGKSVKTRKLPVRDILVGKRWRIAKPEHIAMLRDSLRENGLHTPIGVRPAKKENGKDREAWVLIYGATRLTAARAEGCLSLVTGLFVIARRRQIVCKYAGDSHIKYADMT